MCRYNQLWGLVLLAFGLGILLGAWMEGGFLCYCFGFGLGVAGFLVFKH
jgi:hypothetical protein